MTRFVQITILNKNNPDLRKFKKINSKVILLWDKHPERQSDYKNQ